MSTATMTDENIIVDHRGNNAIVMNGDSSFTFEVAENPRQFDTYKPKRDSLEWNDYHFNVGGWRILPYGDNNDLPKEIQRAVQNNAYAPGMLEKLVGLLWGKGPDVYTETKEGELVIRNRVNDDTALAAWLKSWGYEDYVLRSCESYSYMQGFFTKFYRNKARRIGSKDMIAKLEHTDIDSCRLAAAYETNSLKPTHIVETDFSFNSIDSLTGMKVYSIFNANDPFAVPTAMYYSNKYSFGSKTYTNPKLFGTISWLRQSTAVPLIIEAFTNNSINAKYHIISPQEFWDQAEEKLEKLAIKQGKVYTPAMLDEYKDKLLKGVSKVLGGPENAGKFWHSVKVLAIEGNNLIEQGWEIKEIPQNIKEFVDAHITISKHSIQNLTGAIGVHSANANVSESGKSDSGSEQLYAFQNHKLTSNAIPEMIIMKPMNMALEANFPGKGYKMGFFHEAAQRQQDLSESDRLKNKQ